MSWYDKFDQLTNSGEGEIVSRTFRVFRFDLHPTQNSLIVRGEITVTITTALCCEVVAEETRDFKKIIRLEGLTPDCENESLLEDVFEACPFLNQDLSSHILAAINILKSREHRNEGFNTGRQSAVISDLPDYFEDAIANCSETDLESVDMTRIDKYVDLLYEDFADKTTGASCIYRLTKSSENLVAVSNHETALNALFRTLREDFRKSMDLTTNILHVCLNYAQFKDFHKLLITNKICSLTFDIIEFELNRYDRWRKEIYRRRGLSMEGSIKEKSKHEYERMRLKFNALTRKQDNLLTVAFNVILHLSENAMLFQEIQRRGILELLVHSLERKNLDLLHVVVLHLKNIAIYHECRALMWELRVVEKIAELLSVNIPNELIDLCLRLLFNLSFDHKQRYKMIKLGIMSRIATLYDDPTFEVITRKILYNMSMERRIRPKMPANIALTTLHRIITCNKMPDAIELAALAVNLAGTKKCSAAICENDGVVALFQKSYENENELLMKVLRNLSEQKTSHVFFQDFTGDLANAIINANSDEFIIECIGTLANLDLPNLDFCKLIKEFKLISWLREFVIKSNDLLFLPGENNIKHRRLLSESLVLIGTYSGDADCATLFVKEGIVDILFDLLVKWGNDIVELSLQIIFAFYKLSKHPHSRKYILEKTKIPDIMMELIRDGPKRVRDMCEATLDLLGEHNEIWKSKSRKHRFLAHNESWIEIMERMKDNPEIEQEITTEVETNRTEIGTMTKTYRGFSDTHSEASFSMSEDIGSESESELSHRDEDNKSTSTESDANKCIFDRFQQQYEQEMQAKERLEYVISDEDEDVDVNISN